MSEGYARFSIDGTYDGDTVMRCHNCGATWEWTWQEQDRLVDYLAAADEHVCPPPPAVEIR